MDRAKWRKWSFAGSQGDGSWCCGLCSLVDAYQATSLVCYLGSYQDSLLHPEMHWSVDLTGKNISRDPIVAENFEKDPLSEKKVYLKAIQGPLQGGMDNVEHSYKYWPESKPFWPSMVPVIW